MEMYYSNLPLKNMPWSAVSLQLQYPWDLPVLELRMHFTQVDPCQQLGWAGQGTPGPGQSCPMEDQAFFMLRILVKGAETLELHRSLGVFLIRLRLTIIWIYICSIQQIKPLLSMSKASYSWIPCLLFFRVDVRKESQQSGQSQAQCPFN